MQKSILIFIAGAKKSDLAKSVSITLSLNITALAFSALFPCSSQAQNETLSGPLYSDFRLTLDSGRRQEVLGPLFYSQQSDSQRQWDLAPLFCHTRTPDVDWTETDVLYPLFTSRRFGSEYRAQFFQLLSVSGGKTQPGPDFDQFTIFPLYFQSRSTNPDHNYTALAPFYGHLRNRLFRDETKFVLFPLYSETRKKERRDR